MPRRFKGNLTLLAVAIFLALAHSASAEGSEINRTITKSVDLTGDGIPDAITLHYSGANTTSAYTWTLTITSSGKTIFSHSQTDGGFDKYFGDEGFVAECAGYFGCKNKYYEHAQAEGLGARVSACIGGLKGRDRSGTVENTKYRAAPSGLPVEYLPSPQAFSLR